MQSCKRVTELNHLDEVGRPQRARFLQPVLSAIIDTIRQLRVLLLNITFNMY